LDFGSSSVSETEIQEGQVKEFQYTTVCNRVAGNVEERLGRVERILADIRSNQTDEKSSLKLAQKRRKVTAGRLRKSAAVDFETPMENERAPTSDRADRTGEKRRKPGGHLDGQGHEIPVTWQREA
jgi:hypothetical protein